jgi:hypothetical protein
MGIPSTTTADRLELDFFFLGLAPAPAASFPPEAAVFFGLICTRFIV